MFSLKKHKIQKLKEEDEVLSDKIHQLKMGLYNENHPGRRFELKKEIEQAENELKCIEKQLEQIQFVVKEETSTRWEVTAIHSRTNLSSQGKNNRKNLVISFVVSFIIGLSFLIFQIFQQDKFVYSSVFAIVGFIFVFVILSLRIISYERWFVIVVLYGAILIGCTGIEYKLTTLKWITLETDYVHLGDVNSQMFNPIEPQGISKTYHFVLDKDPSVIKIRIALKDVDPDVRNGPLLIAINNIPIQYLNDYFSDIQANEEHKVSWRNIAINNIPPGHLKKGNNELTIAVLDTPMYGVDDINFHSLCIGYR